VGREKPETREPIFFGGIQGGTADEPLIRPWGGRGFCFCECRGEFY